jgi:hypothetical protein
MCVCVRACVRVRVRVRVRVVGSSPIHASHKESHLAHHDICVCLASQGPRVPPRDGGVNEGRRALPPLPFPSHPICVRVVLTALTQNVRGAG